MERQQQYMQLIETLFRVINKFYALEKIPRDYGVGENFYRQEIHAIAVIGNHPDINVMQLAEQLGVTKGTISPVVTKLEKRGYVSKLKGGESNKEILLRLTIKGQMAYHGHEMFHLKLHAELFEEFDRENPEHIEFLKRFLQVGEHLVDKYLQTDEKL
ncbi:transcriptional regulator, MarR family [Candidatus Vecturithrix granuli]|uniref:Transcriptional regulator, MarR family n=1 Tax=Vecturithrix granuli TaxID=1499967 RepID=A0A081C1X3_VECG1|nr:transcriptional regulator, MarR family [Candidatus Vecturithrix granuli]